MAKKERAGLILFKIKPSTKEIFFKCMVPSDPQYGGSQPQIPKGVIEDGYSSSETALKEACEEIGLKLDNLAWFSHFKYYKQMRIDVYFGTVYNPKDFNQAHWETGAKGWVNYSQNRNLLRVEQMQIFDEVADHIEETIIKQYLD